jgi:predicted porin
MKRLSCGVAVLCAASTSAYAQSSVSLYGIIDEGITYTSNQKGYSNWQLQSGGASISRWGFRGVEDLGGGLKTIFVLEGGFDPSTGNIGNNGALFGRSAYVGIASQYGTVTLGRQYDEMANLLSKTNAGLNWSVYLAHLNDVDNTAGVNRINNAVKYASPVIGGFTVETLYSFGGVAGQFATNSVKSFGLSYANGPLYAAAAYTYIKNPLASVFGGVLPNAIAFAAYLPHAQSQEIWGTGAQYNFGKATLGLQYTSTRFGSAFEGADVRFDNYEANLGYQFRRRVHLHPRDARRNAAVSNLPCSWPLFRLHLVQTNGYLPGCPGAEGGWFCNAIADYQHLGAIEWSDTIDRAHWAASQVLVRRLHEMEAVDDA